MKEGFRQAMGWLHTWAGLVFGWVLFMIFVTGTLTVYEVEITHWMQPEARGTAATPHRALTVAEDYLRRHAAGAVEWAVDLPDDRNPVLGVHWHMPGVKEEVKKALDPATGAELFRRETDGGAFYNEMHYELRAGRLGLWIVGLIGVALCVAIVTGIIVHKRIFKDFFTLRLGKGQRSWLDAHNLTGVMALPFLVMIAYTGVSISTIVFVPAGAEMRYEGQRGKARADVVRRFQREPAGEPGGLLPFTAYYDRAITDIGLVGSLVVHHPGDSRSLVQLHRPTTDRLAAVGDHVTYDGPTGERFGMQTEWNPYAYVARVLVGLHVVGFGGWMSQALYFLSGIAGCVLIASGQVLFIAKRRDRPGAVNAGFLSFAERLNVAAIAGVMLACAGYLWANRLIPADLPGRAGREVLVFFALWLLSVPHAFTRPPRAAWVEQLGATAALCLFLPVLNHLMTGTGLPVALARGDAITIATDLTAAILGLCLTGLTWKVATHRPAMRGAMRRDGANGTRRAA